jgi:hypothetical protein
MATRRANTANPAGVQISPEDLERGPVTINHQHTVSKVVGDGTTMDDHGAEPITAEDLEMFEWLVYRQEDDGWVFKDKTPRRPYEPDLRDWYGHGRYRVLPEGPDGRPLEQFSSVLKVGRATHHSDEDGDEKRITPAAQIGSAMDPMLQFMSLQMQSTVQREAEAARRDETRREREEEREEKRQLREEEREEKRQIRESTREERLEREARAKSDAEGVERVAKSEADAAERTARSDLTSTLATSVMGAVTAIGTAMMENRNSNPDPRLAPQRGDNVSDKLLDGFLKLQQLSASARVAPSSDGGGPRQAMEMLVLLDQLAANRAAAQMPQ